MSLSSAAKTARISLDSAAALEQGKRDEYTPLDVIQEKLMNEPMLPLHEHLSNAVDNRKIIKLKNEEVQALAGDHSTCTLYAVA